VRTAFVDALTELAGQDSSVILMTGDLGFGVLDEYRDQLPDQFLNVGVAEQNLAGVAAGLALTGHRVFTYSIGNFPTLRCLEQIRNDICYHDVDVTVVTVGGGMAYGALGPSHFALEDLAIMRALPNMTVIAPGDPHEVRALLPQIMERRSPTYLRLGRAGEPEVHDPSAEIILGQPSLLQPGDGRACIVSTGGMLSVAQKAARVLAGNYGLLPSLVSLHTLAPVDPGGLEDVLAGHEVIVTCEEHSVVGGLGSLIAEHLAERDGSARLVRMGLPRGFPTGIGSQDYLRKVNGLDEDALVRRIARELGVQRL
jgi:transketolase